MASTNFVVHLIAGGALFLAFWYIAVLRKRLSLLEALFARSKRQRLTDPVKLLEEVFEFYDIPLESEYHESPLKMVALSEVGSLLSMIRPVGGKIMGAGQKIVFVLSYRDGGQTLSQDELKKSLSRALKVDCELNLLEDA